MIEEEYNIPDTYIVHMDTAYWMEEKVLTGCAINWDNTPDFEGRHEIDSKQNDALTEAVIDRIEYILKELL